MLKIFLNYRIVLGNIYCEQHVIWSFLPNYRQLVENKFKQFPHENLGKSCIQEKKHLLSDADSSTDTTVGWNKNTQKPEFFGKTEKIIQHAKTQKRLEICQYKRYAHWPEVSNPSGSVASTMFCKAKSAKKTNFFCAVILDHFQTKIFKCESSSFHYFSPRIPNL